MGAWQITQAQSVLCEADTRQLRDPHCSSPGQRLGLWLPQGTFRLRGNCLLQHQEWSWDRGDGSPELHGEEAMRRYRGGGAGSGWQGP